MANRSRRMPLHIDTPLVESLPLTVAAGCPVWLKLEALQPSGSFKLRGIGRACEVQQARGARRFVSSSGGNAGLAVAYAGRRLGVPVTVVVPETATPRARELLRLEGAEVVVHGASWQEANELAQSLVGPTDAFLHPFDDPILWEGHATIVDEVARTGLRPGSVVAVGGRRRSPHRRRAGASPERVDGRPGDRRRDRGGCLVPRRAGRTWRVADRRYDAGVVAACRDRPMGSNLVGILLHACSTTEEESRRVPRRVGEGSETRKWARS